MTVEFGQENLFDPPLHGSLRRRLWRYANVIFGSSAIGFLVGFLILFMLPAQYDAIAVIAAPIDRSVAKIRGDTSVIQSSGLLSSLALGSQPASPLLQRLLQTLHSQRLAEKLFDNKEITKELFSSQWNSSTNDWIQPSGILSSPRGVMLRFLNRPVWTPPTPWHLHAILEKDILITALPGNSAFQIKYVCQKPSFCQGLLRAVIDQADSLIRERVVQNDQNYTEFLTKRLQTVTDVNDRQVLSTLLSDIRRDEMLAASGSNYSVDVIDEAAVSTVPTEPKIGLTLALGLFAGLLLSTIGVVTWESLGLRTVFNRLQLDVDSRR